MKTIGEFTNAENQQLIRSRLIKFLKEVPVYPINEIAKEAGISAATLRGFLKGKPMLFVTLARVDNWLEMKELK